MRPLPIYCWAFPSILFSYMNNLDQTACPTCKGEYSEKNPPRLLTMCGHTFCEKCIKELMPKKKANGKARVICPIDKKSI